MSLPTNAFRTAVEAGDHDAIAPLLAEQVAFLSPVAFTPYHGREMVAAILRGAGRAFSDFRYEREIRSEDGRTLPWSFAPASVTGRSMAVTSCDWMTPG